MSLWSYKDFILINDIVCERIVDIIIGLLDIATIFDAFEFFLKKGVLIN